jgi:hypothetical protein
MISPLRQAHGVESKLVSLKCQLQAAGRTHRSPGRDLALVKFAKALAQHINCVIAVWVCGFI